jgi:hypothetical protein
VHPDELVERQEALGAWLAGWRPLWASRPFTGIPVAWEEREPALAAWLRARTDQEVERFEGAPAAHPEAPSLLRALTARGEALARVPTLTEGRPGGHPPTGVPGRKWGQVRAFLGLLGPAARPSVDWCAGKGHLGRALAAATGASVDCVERDPGLCAAGRALAEREGLPVRFWVGDVLAEPGPAVVQPGRRLVALHACGDLGTRALTLATERGSAGLVVAPCCFHRVRAPRYAPLAGPDLGLDRDLLRLPCSEEVVASARLRRLRRREMHLRTVVDLLLRAHTGRDRYRNLPPVPDPWLTLPLADFVARISARDGLALDPSPGALEEAERAARERLRQARALSFVRVPFRRPLEVFLALDRARWLTERGWRVRVGTFCDPALTPRNLALVADG